MSSIVLESISAQEYLVSIQPYSVPQGLSNRYIRYVEQDWQGFIWIATPSGLNRFDGYSFQQFTSEVHGFRTNNFEQIFEDRKGRLWLLCQMPAAELRWVVDIFDSFEQRAVPLEKAFQLPFDVEKIGYIRSDLSGNIYILLSNGQMYRFDGANFKHILNNCPVRAAHFAVLPNGILGIIDSNRITQFDSVGNKLYETQLPAPVDFIYPAADRFLVEQTEGMSPSVLWSVRAGQQPQSFHFRSEQGELIGLNRPFEHINPLFYDRNGRWWAYTNEGLFLFDSKGNFLYNFSSQLEAFENPTNITFDSRNVAWVGTITGLYSIAVSKNLFTNYLTSENLVDTRGIVQDKKRNLYIVQSGEVWQLNQFGHSIPLGIPAHVAAIKDKMGILWFSDYSSRVYSYNPLSGEKKIFTPFNNIQKPVVGGTRALCADVRTGRIWIGVENGGLAYIDTVKNAIVPFTAYNQFQALQNNTITCFLQDKSDIWLGTRKGIYLLRPEVGIVAEYSQQTGDLPFDDIYHIHKDRQGIFWLATYGGGLIRWDKNKKTCRQFTHQDGLSNDVIYAVYEDEFGYLWLPSNYGLMRFNTSTWQASTYLPRDGIPHEEFNFTSHYQTDDGRLFFGGLKGVTAFYPKDFYQKEQALSYQTMLSVSEYLELDGTTGAFIDKTLELNPQVGIRLPPQNKCFILKVAFSDYQNPKDNRFAYRIEGLNMPWNYQTSNAFQINNLPYGSYKLRIKAQGANGQWVAEELQLPLVIIRPFYLRWWFILVAVMIITTIIWWRIQIIKQAAVKLEAEVVKRTHQIEQTKKIVEKQAMELRQLDELKSRFFANVAHELRTPITLILTPLKKLLRNADLDNRSFTTLKVIESNATDLMRLAEEILDMDKLEAQRLKLEEETVAFYPFMRRLISNFESHTQNRGIELQLNYNPEQFLQLKVDRKKLERILFNLLSNAVKFTDRTGKVTVTVSDTANSIQVEVKDTGRGIHLDDLPHIFDRFYQAKYQSNQVEGGAGIGLALAQEYTKLMRGTLSVESQLDEGSTFSLQLPKQEILGVPTDNASEAAVQGEQWNAEVTTGQQLLTREAKVITEPQQQGLVMVVEDNSDLRRFIQDIFSLHYEVLTAENGTHAVELLESLSANEAADKMPDLITTDLMMPKMDGYNLLKVVKADKRWRGIPIIVLTAKASLNDRLAALRIGVDEYLAKPFETEELLVRAENLIKNYRNRQSFLRKKNKAPFSDANEWLTAKESLSVDQQWLEKVEEAALQGITSNEFTVRDFADVLALSERQLLRKLKQLTGMTTSDYLREIRLQKARRLLENKSYSTVAEVCYAVGLSNLKHFTELFHKRFGKNPSELLRSS